MELADDQPVRHHPRPAAAPDPHRPEVPQPPPVPQPSAVPTEAPRRPRPSGPIPTRRVMVPPPFPPPPIALPYQPPEVDEDREPAPMGFGGDDGGGKGPDPPLSSHPVIGCHGYESVETEYFFPGEPCGEAGGREAPPEPKFPPKTAIPKPRGSLGAALGLSSCGFRPSMVDDPHQKKRKQQVVTLLEI